MNCVRCEVTRAKITARFWLGWGLALNAVVAKLNAAYPGRYVKSLEEDGSRIFRLPESGAGPIEIIFQPY